MRPSTAFVAAASFAVISAAPAHAEREWGALALSERSTAYGYAKDFDTREGASERALAECARNARDCRLHTAWRNTCLVLAGTACRDGAAGLADTTGRRHHAGARHARPRHADAAAPPVTRARAAYRTFGEAT
jgi:hypothetical protein